MGRISWLSTIVINLFLFHTLSIGAEPTQVLPSGQRLVGKLAEGPAKENSGIVKSRNQQDVFWMHNDSGDEPRIYAIHRDGTIHSSDRYPETPGTLIGGAINVDWEDITAMEDGTLIVGDVGNNQNDRRDLTLYLIDEPAAAAGRTTFRKKIFIRYPDQPSIPAPTSDFNYDCEAIFSLGKDLIFLTKHRSNQATKVYRLSDFSEGITHPLDLLEEFELEGQAVAADSRPDGSQIVVASYDTLWLFEVIDPKHPLSLPIGRFDYKGEQVEAVCFADAETVLISDEQTANLYEVKLAAFKPYDKN